MDGITNSPTLGGVVLAALSAAGYAVFKVRFSGESDNNYNLKLHFPLSLGYVSKGDG